MNVQEGRAWGVILPDVTRHVAEAMEAVSSIDRAQTIREIQDSYLEELDKPTSAATGEFVIDKDLPGDQSAQ